MEPFLRNSSRVLTRAFNARALQKTSQAARYDFQRPAVLRNVPPPTVQFNRPLHWRSLDRRKRLATVMCLRDHLLEDILRIGGTPRRPGRHTTMASP